MAASTLLPLLAASAAANAANVSLVRSLQSPPAATLLASYEPPSPRSATELRAADELINAVEGFLPLTPHLAATRARVRLYLGDYAGAATFAQVAANSGDRVSRYRVGNAYAAEGRLDEALAAWIAAASSGPAERLDLAEGLFAQSSWTHYHPERWAHAIAVLHATLAELTSDDPYSAPVRLRLAEMLLHTRRTDEAEQVLRELVASEPSNPTAQAALAWLLLDTGRTAAALDVVGTRPHHDDPWQFDYVRGASQLAHCDVDGAVSSFERAIRRPSADYRQSWALRSLADARWEQRRPSAALEAWRAYLERQPGDSPTRERMNSAQKAALGYTCPDNEG